jgi:hypothetical protein
MKQQVLPLLNQERFDADFESLADDFQRITIGMMGAQGGAEDEGHTSRCDMQRPRKQARIGPHKNREESRRCYFCGEKVTLRELVQRIRTSIMVLDRAREVLVRGDSLSRGKDPWFLCILGRRHQVNHLKRLSMTSMNCCCSIVEQPITLCIRALI